jgi:hypothetical protein
MNGRSSTSNPSAATEISKYHIERFRINQETIREIIFSSKCLEILMTVSSAADRNVQSTMQGANGTETAPKQPNDSNVKTILETDVCSRFIQQTLWK